MSQNWAERLKSPTRFIMPLGSNSWGDHRDAGDVNAATLLPLSHIADEFVPETLMVPLSVVVRDEAWNSCFESTARM